MKPFNLKRPVGVELPYREHNAIFNCTGCSEGCMQAQMKRKGYGRKNMRNHIRVLWMNKKGKNTFVQIDDCYVNYESEEVRVDFVPLAQYKFNRKVQEYYRRESLYDNGERWNRMGKVKIPRDSMRGFHWRYSVPTCIYDELRVGTDLKYAKLGDKIHDEDYLINYINDFSKYKSIELLEKAGFRAILTDRLYSEVKTGINVRGNTLQKILRLSKKEIKDYPRQEGINFLNVYRTWKKYLPKLTFQDVQDGFLFDQYASSLSAVKGICSDIEDIVSVNKVYDYCVKKRIAIINYRDYIVQMYELEDEIKKLKAQLEVAESVKPDEELMAELESAKEQNKLTEEYWKELLEEAGKDADERVKNKEIELSTEISQLKEEIRKIKESSVNQAEYLQKFKIEADLLQQNFNALLKNINEAPIETQEKMKKGLRAVIHGMDRRI